MIFIVLFSNDRLPINLNNFFSYVARFDPSPDRDPGHRLDLLAGLVGALLPAITGAFCPDRPLYRGFDLCPDSDLFVVATSELADSLKDMSYTCPRCGAISHNPHDEANRYCSRCG